MEKMHETYSFRTPITYQFSLRKRAFDMIASLLLLIFCVPLLIIISILILLFSGRPIFFTQTRTGIQDSRFTILKFRTMKLNACTDERHQYNWENGVPDSFQFKTANDLAVTKIGKFLRKYSLDELPQLLNVFGGDMSLVGPRPEIPAITQLYSSEQSKRLMVKPGITGYAQVNGRSDIDHGKKIEYDLFYVRNCSILLDMKIILATAMSVIRSKGAY